MGTVTPQPKNALRFTLGLLLSVLSGVMLLLAFPPYGIWPLAWFAMVPYRFAQYRLFPLKWSSLAEAVALLCWLGPFMARLFGAQFGPFFTYLGVLIAILTFFISKSRKFHELTGYRWFILEGVAGWVGFEMVRATVIPLVATSAFIGYTQATQAWLIQPVSIFSVYGLNCLILLVNFVLVQVLLALFDRRSQPAGSVPVSWLKTRPWVLAAVILLTGWIGISLAILNGGPKDAEPVKVAAIQPNYSLPAFQDESNPSPARVEAFAQAARQAASQGAQIIFTPEMQFNFDPQVEFTAELQSLARETNAYLFIDYTVAVEGQPWRNEAVLLSPSGEFSAVYGKNHYPPGEPRGVSAGVYPVFDTPLGKLAAMICHDANYTDVARRLARNGAQLISSGVNEFGGFGEQYWTNVTFRAVENRAAVVVTARQSGSAIIDAYGRQVALTIEANKAVTLLGEVAPGPGKAPYSWLGDILGWVTLAAFIFFIVFSGVMVKRLSPKPSKGS